MNRKFKFLPDEYYHVYNRGTDKRIIFDDINDYERFLILLYLVNNEKSINLRLQSQTFAKRLHSERGTQIVDICGYVLMPNHFHLLITPIFEDSIPLFMQRLSTAYVMYYNQKNGRKGSLFQGTYKAKHVDGDNYLQHLLAYIHLNPLKLIQPDWKENGINNTSDAEDFLNTYRYSSFLDYTGTKRIENKIVSLSKFPTEKTTSVDFANTIHSWLKG